MTEPESSIDKDGGDVGGSKTGKEGEDDDWRQLVQDVRGIKTQMAGWNDVLDSKLGDLKTTLTTRIGDFEQSLQQSIATLVTNEVSKFTAAIQDDIENISSRVTKLEDKVDQLSTTPVSATDDADERSVLLKGFKGEHDEPPLLCDEIQLLFKDVLDVVCTVKNAATITIGQNNTRCVKVELLTVDDRMQILQNKKKCKDHERTKGVFIDRVKSQLELVMEHNSRMLLKEFGRKGMRVTGTGRIVRAGDNRAPQKQNTDPGTSAATTQQQAQSSAGPAPGPIGGAAGPTTQSINTANSNKVTSGGTPNNQPGVQATSGGAASNGATAAKPGGTQQNQHNGQNPPVGAASQGAQASPPTTPPPAPKTAGYEKEFPEPTGGKGGRGRNKGDPKNANSIRSTRSNSQPNMSNK